MAKHCAGRMDPTTSVEVIELILEYKKFFEKANTDIVAI